jgi:hypothetical protein
MNDTQKKAPWWWCTYIKKCRSCRMLLINYQKLSGGKKILYLLMRKETQKMYSLNSMKPSPKHRSARIPWVILQLMRVITQHKCGEDQWNCSNQAWRIFFMVNRCNKDRAVINPLPALTYRNVLDLKIACRAKRTQTYRHVRKFKCHWK